jgi:hypothetical protein
VAAAALAYIIQYFFSRTVNGVLLLYTLPSPPPPFFSKIAAKHFSPRGCCRLGVLYCNISSLEQLMESNYGGSCPPPSFSKMAAKHFSARGSCCPGVLHCNIFLL